MSTAAEIRLERLWETPHSLYGKLSTVDHKEIGRRYLVTAMVFFLVGGLEALTFPRREASHMPRGEKGC